MVATRRDWVALGLILTTHPRMKAPDRADLADPAERVARLMERLENERSLRPLDRRDIFSGNFPDWADKEIRAAHEAAVSIVTWEDAEYPASLRNLPDPPPFLYVKGELLQRDTDAIAIVGSRRATPYGLSATRRVTGGLGSAGLTVISGLARGIDSAAHRAAIEAGGRTIAVLGSGIDIVYPKENRRLFDQITGGCGAVVTEFPFGTAPHPWHFPVRNRIIAALSQAVVVVEAARDSGSLITANLAADMLGLPVGAVPGPITSAASDGCNDLIYDGASPVRGIEDVLYVLPSGVRQRVLPRMGAERAGKAVGPGLSGLGEAARRVLRSLSPDVPRSADDLARQTRLASGAVLGHLLELELRGLAVQLPGGLYLKKH